MTRLAIVGETSSKATGFGKQTHLLAEGLQKKGYDVTAIVGLGRVNPNLKVKQFAYPMGDMIALNRLLEKVSPEQIILFGPLKLFGLFASNQALFCNVPCFIWPAWESSYIEDCDRRLFEFSLEGQVVHLSPFSQQIWGSSCKPSVVIPHGYDPKIYKPCDVVDLDKWNRKLKRSICPDNTILVVDRNTKRKNHDIALWIARELDLQGVDFTMIVHCKRNDQHGFDLDSLISKYEIAHKVVLTDFDWDSGFTEKEMAELYQLSSIRLCCSGGEGFGIPTIESMACGCVNVVPSNTVFPYVAGACCIQDCGGVFYDEAEWSLPNARDMVSRIRELLEEPDLYEKVRKYCIEKAKEFTVDRMIDQWNIHLQTNLIDSRINQRYGLSTHVTRMREKVNLFACLSALECTKIVDIGSGGGETIDIGYECGCEVIGIEKDHRFEQVQTFQANVNTWWMKAESARYDNFEAVFLTRVLHEIENLEDLIKKLRPVKWWFVSHWLDTLWSIYRSKNSTVEEVRKILHDNKIKRNLNVEVELKRKLGYSDLSFEVWQPEELMSDTLPPKLMK